MFIAAAPAAGCSDKRKFPDVTNRLLLALMAGATPLPALAQQPADQPPTAAQPGFVGEPEADQAADLDGDGIPDEEGSAIVVTGQRLRGAVEGDIEPEVQLDARDIRAYGAGTLGELLEALSPQTQSGRGRGGGQPVVLLNGRRISGFGEIRGIPPEAIERVDILPEEVALKYGYRADQRVVNFVLRPRFRAVTTEVEYGFATAGGRPSYDIDANILRLNDNGRFSLDLEYEHQAPLFESERSLIQATPSRPFDLSGNVAPAPGAQEIDPALSALVGTPVTIAGVPVGAPTLSAFAANAGNANVTDLGRYRTLLAETDQFSINGTLNRTILGTVSATLNARLEESESRSNFGLPSATIILPSTNPYSPFASDVSLLRYFDVAGPLAREQRSRNGHVGVAFNGSIDPWRWSFTGNWDRGSSESRTDTGVDIATYQAGILAGDPGLNPFASLPRYALVSSARDFTSSVNQSLDAQAVLNGPLFDLPAGQVSTTVRVGGEMRSFDSRSIRSGLVQERSLGRDRVSAQANVDVPIASRRDDVLQPIGDLSLNANAEVEEISDFGTLTTYGYGLNWSPIEELSFIASVTEEEGAPSVQQLGDATTITPNVRVFDFLRGETVEISRLDGGNPDLLADNRSVLKLGMTLRPLDETDLSISANYTKSRIDNPIASFPTATPELEAAFPERFLRDGTGRLVRIDNRPVNFERSDREELRWGVNFSKPLSQTPPPRGWRQGAGGAGAGAASGAAAPQGRTGQPAGPRPNAAQRRQGGGGGGFRGGGGGFGRGGPQGGRLQLSLYHTWRLEDSILIREGVPELDLLDGSAIGSRGGQSRHQLEFQAGIFKDGLGARLIGNWQSGTRVDGRPDGSGNTTGDLFFSDFATVNLRLFADLGQQRSLVRKYRWLRGTRVSLGINNILDSRLDVRDAAGQTPLSYQPNLLDPLGRSVTISIRKLFF